MLEAVWRMLVKLGQDFKRDQQEGHLTRFWIQLHEFGTYPLLVVPLCCQGLCGVTVLIGG